MHKNKRPNIVIFLMDCVRPDHMSCYGYPIKTTPNIDTLAREGAVFRNAITTSGWTLPTHASLFTGVYPSFHGASKEYLYLDDKYPTMAQILSKNGYETAGFSSVAYVSRETGLDRGFGDFYESFKKNGVKNRINRYTVKNKTTRALSFLFNSYARETIPGKIVNWKVLDWVKKRDISKPFFLFVHYIDAHKPYSYHPYYNRLFIKDDAKLALSKEISGYNWPHLTLNIERIDKEVLLSLYDSKIYSIDYCISEIMRYLKRAGLYDNTVIFLLADHGEIVTDRFDHHFFITDEVLRIPLIVRWSEGFGTGSYREDIVSIVDILPTILDILDIDDTGIKANLNGYSLLRPFKGDRHVVAERGRMNDPWFKEFPDLKKLDCVPPLDCIMKAIRTNRYKYLWSSNGISALYDVLKDPHEKVNLVKEFADVADRLKDILFHFVKMGIKEDQKKSSEIEERLRRSLESLGYL